jgi:hypothetical protein
MWRQQMGERKPVVATASVKEEDVIYVLAVAESCLAANKQIFVFFKNSSRCSYSITNLSEKIF